TPVVFLVLLLIAGTADTKGLKVGEPDWAGTSFTVPLYKLEEAYNDYRISYTVAELDFDFVLDQPHLFVLDDKGAVSLAGTLLTNDFGRWSTIQGFKSLVFKGAGRYELKVPVKGTFNQAPDVLLRGLSIESNENSPERNHFERIGFAQQLKTGHNMLILNSVFVLSLVICLVATLLLIFRAGR
ncbi:MAG: hypothetical protein KDC44_09200, partial [Phaeodactylibacter sp.]|nr:hypothetical protein [Phaeodactylibacter sp.]